MSFTYDPSTPSGKVRLLALDTVQANAAFADDEIQAFLDLSGGVVLLAAAQALDQLAANAALVQGKTQVEGIVVDGTAVAPVLHAQAMELRRQCYEGDDGTGISPIDWAELVVDPFAYRERLVNEMLRQST